MMGAKGCTIPQNWWKNVVKLSKSSAKYQKARVKHHEKGLGTGNGGEWPETVRNGPK